MSTKVEQNGGPSLVFVKTKAREGEAYPERPVDRMSYLLPVIRVLPWYSTTPTNDELQVSHAGYLTTRREDVEAGGPELAHSYSWQPEGMVFPAIRHNGLLYLSYQVQAFFCGFQVLYSEWETVTLAGDLQLSRATRIPSWDGTAPNVDKWGIQHDLAVSGSGAAVAIGRVAIEGHLEDDTLHPGVRIHCQVTKESPGTFWVGVLNGPGVRYKDGDVEHVLLDATGAVSSVVRSAEYVVNDDVPNLRRIELGWEVFSTGERINVFGGTHSTPTQTVVTVHEPNEMPRHNFELVFGLEHDSPDATGWDWGATCGGIYDCAVCPDMPTPGTATIGTTGELAFLDIPSGPWAGLTPESEIAPDLFALINSELVSGTADAAGTKWVKDCVWSATTGEIVLPQMGPYDTVKEILTVSMGYQSGFISLPGCGGDDGSAVGVLARNHSLAVDGYVLTARYTLTWRIGSVGHSQASTAIYVGPSELDCLGVNDFTLAYAGHDPDGHTVETIPDNYCDFPWIDYTSWPASLPVEMS